jgi:primosomal protein N' (replication factor Y)
VPRALDVLLPLPLSSLRWLAPFGGADPAVGDVVVVPWQGGVRAGLVTGVSDAGGSRALELKEAIGRLEGTPRLSEATVAWILTEAERTVAPAGTVLAGLSPSWSRLPLDHRVRELDASGAPPGPWRAAERVDPARLSLLREQGLVEETVTPRLATVRRLVPATPTPTTEEEAALAGAARAPQRTALARLREDGAAESAAALARTAGVGESPVRTLVRKGLARYEERTADPPSAPPPPAPRPWPEGDTPPPGASEPPAWIDGGTRARRLAAVVPALRADLAAGRSPIVLAPERALAEEAAGWLASEVPVAGLRLDDDPLVRRAWEADRSSGPPRVVVGTAPVLATPLARPGRLVVIEAGAESYKQRSGARAWIPAAARTWCDRHDVPLHLLDVIAGPETRATAAGAGRELPRPRVRWVLSDLSRGHGWPLGDEAVRVVRQVAARERQALVLVPRRGFSAALGCRDCGAAVMCPNCDLALRWHARDGRLRCHQCGHDAPPPAVCPSCGGPDLEAQRAAGSEWVLRALAGVAPDLPRYRFDGDVRDDLAPLREGAPGILVGTSALLRLAPLPVLSLIVVTQIDGALHADDFRAEERVLRTLAALQESAGARAPLGVIQTFSPHHPLLAAVARGTPDALGEALGAMDERRRRFGYPPYGRMARVQASARREADAWAALREVAARLRAAGATDDEILGPAAAPVARVRGRALAHLLLRTRDEARRRRLLTDATAGPFRGVRLRVDVDPRDIGEVLE